jgi:hypothetical protein
MSIETSSFDMSGQQVDRIDRLFRFAEASHQNPDPTTKEALRYRTALHLGCQRLSRTKRDNYRLLLDVTASERCLMVQHYS